MHKGKTDTGLFGEPARSYFRERRLMRREFASSLMSSTKWRKLFEAIERLELDLPMCRVKWTDADNVIEMWTPTRASFHPPRAFIDTQFGPIALCSIEWLEFPARIVTTRGYDFASRIILSDLETVEKALLSIARFPIEHTADALRIIGHVR